MKILALQDYGKLTSHLNQVKFNNLFARSVIEKKVCGKVYVDNRNNPQTFYIVHPYGMSLLFGRSDNAAFNDKFLAHALNKSGSRSDHEWMQAYPDKWDKVLRDLFGPYLVKSSGDAENRGHGTIELNTRVNFKFSRQSYATNKPSTIPRDIRIVRTDQDIYMEMEGSVVPSHFWDSADDFLTNGIGFSLLYNGQLATTAYSAFIHDDKLELGIETKPAFRGKGFALYACSALVDYALENNYEPVWACRLENTGSYKLAQKLGFEPALNIPYYRLSN